MKKTKLGRPPLPQSKLKKYQRMAVYHSTYKNIRERAKKAEMTMVDYLEEMFP